NQRQTQAVRLDQIRRCHPRCRAAREASVRSYPLDGVELPGDVVGDPPQSADVGLAGEELAIVDPPSGRRLAAGAIGEVWVRGPHVARGYWRNPEETRAAFAGRIAGKGASDWLRTGDLGFLDTAGELFITGRIKDLIIIRGVNHYPQDIEHTVESCHPALRRHGGAAFGVSDENGAERLVIVQEVERAFRHRLDPREVAATIREAVTREHDLTSYRIVLIRPGTLPQTTSGKIQRGRARQLWLAGALEVVA
ncbi:MAG: AMP-binding protein, partial [Terriglobia bacterium]